MLHREKSDHETIILFSLAVVFVLQKNLLQTFWKGIGSTLNEMSIVAFDASYEKNARKRGAINRQDFVLICSRPKLQCMVTITILCSKLG